MRREEFFEVLGELDEELVKDAELPARGHPHRRLATVLIAAVMAVLLMGAGVASVLYGENIQSWFSHYWEQRTGESMSGGQMQTIDHLSCKIDTSQTVEGVTVTVDSATVGDDSFFLLLRIKGPEFSKRYSYKFENVYMDVDPIIADGDYSMYGFGFQFKGLDADGSAIILLDYSYINGGEFTADDRMMSVDLKLKNLEESHGGDTKLLQEGEWHFEFTLNRSAALQKMSLPNTEVMILDIDKQEEVAVFLEDIELTSTGLRFRYDYYDGTLALSPHLDAVMKSAAGIGSGGGSGTVGEDGEYMYFSYQWEVPIDLDELDYVQIGGTKIYPSDGN
ncbi:MAG: hypothetical protein ACOX81_01915 [Candidatus Heteroscillospira sp.]|jgi:hypothetical protein